MDPSDEIETSGGVPGGGTPPVGDRGLKAGVAVTLFAVALVFAISYLQAGRESNCGPTSTANSMRQLAIGLEMRANETKGAFWPGFARKDGIWVPDLAVMYPDYLPPPATLVALEHPEREHIAACLELALQNPGPDFDTAAGLVAMSFAYIGCAVYDEAGFARIVEARKAGLLDGTGKYIVLPDERGTVVPFRQQVERFMITDINGPGGAVEQVKSSIPVLVETWQWRLRESGRTIDGAHVLYLDGHVAQVPFGTFPVVPVVMDALCGVVP